MACADVRRSFHVERMQERAQLIYTLTGRRLRSQRPMPNTAGIVFISLRIF